MNFFRLNTDSQHVCMLITYAQNKQMIFNECKHKNSNHWKHHFEIEHAERTHRTTKQRDGFSLIFHHHHHHTFSLSCCIKDVIDVIKKNNIIPRNEYNYQGPEKFFIIFFFWVFGIHLQTKKNRIKYCYYYYYRYLLLLLLLLLLQTTLNVLKRRRRVSKVGVINLQKNKRTNTHHLLMINGKKLNYN